MTAVFHEKLGVMRVVNTDNLVNVVHSVQYELVCHYRGESLLNTFYVELEAPSSESFVGFEGLSQEQVMQWVRDGIGSDALEERKDAMQKMIDQIIDARDGSPRDVLPPWVNNHNISEAQ